LQQESAATCSEGREVKASTRRGEDIQEKKRRGYTGNEVWKVLKFTLRT